MLFPLLTPYIQNESTCYALDCYLEDSAEITNSAKIVKK